MFLSVLNRQRRERRRGRRGSRLHSDGQIATGPKAIVAAKVSPVPEPDRSLLPAASSSRD